MNYFFSKPWVNVFRLLWNCNKLQDHRDERDEGGAQDGHRVVQDISVASKSLSFLNLSHTSTLKQVNQKKVERVEN